MTEIPNSRRRLFLPLLTSVRHGSRSHTTCYYKCGNACDAAVPNRTDNPTFESVVQTALSRRALLKAAGAGALVVAAGPLFSEPAAAAPGRRGATGDGALTFEPVEQNFLDELVIPAGYRSAVVMRWGDPVEEGAPEFDVDAQTGEAQAKQFGYNCDFIGFLPLGRRRALLVVNHEYTNEQLMFSGVAEEEAPTTDEQKRVAMMAHGISVVQVQRQGDSGVWLPTPERDRNRRITASTPFRVTGPAAGSQYLRTTADPEGRTVLGTLNNCAGGITPWGTWLTCEETERKAGTKIGGRELKQDHGYVFEVDPVSREANLDRSPRPLTCLGRYSHEAVAVDPLAGLRAASHPIAKARGSVVGQRRCLLRGQLRASGSGW
jgi:uncharacterized protein